MEPIQQDVIAPAMTRALPIELWREVIFRDSAYSTLVSCLFVSKSWNRNALQVLNARPKVFRMRRKKKILWQRYMVDYELARSDLYSPQLISWFTDYLNFSVLPAKLLRTPDKFTLLAAQSNSAVFLLHQS